ncbi:MAG TPA: outer membrane lipoprotein-sorting protein, partial [Usitatibacter sp.]|nr:outer membrane lipoprotein-sorting protein [Usitatibacter sp.]
MRRRALCWLAACLVALPVAAAPVDGTQLLQKVDRNLEPESYESYRQLTDIQPDGTKKVSVLYTMKKGRDRIAALFLAPASDKGRVTLRLGDNMWLYMPDVGRAIRITSLQAVTGGVF